MVEVGYRRRLTWFWVEERGEMHPFSSWEKMRGNTSEKETGERYLVGSLLQSSLFML